MDWILKPACAFITYQVGLLFINVLLISAAYGALPKCLYGQSTSDICCGFSRSDITFLLSKIFYAPMIQRITCNQTEHI